MYAKVFHINPEDYTAEQFDVIIERAKDRGYTRFDFTETSALDVNSLDCSNWQTIETRDVLASINSGALRADMIDSTNAVYTPDYELDQVKGITQAEVWELAQQTSAKVAKTQEELNKTMSYFNS